GVYKVFIEDYISQSHMFTYVNERYIRERAFHATCIGESPEIVYIAGGAKNEELTKYNHKTKALISIKTENSIILKRNFFTMSFIRDHKNVPLLFIFGGENANGMKCKDTSYFLKKETFHNAKWIPTNSFQKFETGEPSPRSGH